MGMVNEVWIVGDRVLRISLDDEAEDNAALEARIVPQAVSAGLRTPRLKQFDDSRAIVPRAYSIYEKASGATLGTLPPKGGPWIAQLAEQAALLHRAPTPVGEKLQSVATRSELARSIRKSVDQGCISAADGELLDAWCDRLTPAFEAPYEPRFIHNDLHPWNLLADPETYELTAILDWGDGGAGDQALDLIGLPTWGMIPLVEEYRRLAGVQDDHLEGRILVEWLCIALWEERELSTADYQRAWWRWPSTNLQGMIGELGAGGERWRQWLPL